MMKIKSPFVRHDQDAIALVPEVWRVNFCYLESAFVMCTSTMVVPALRVLLVMVRRGCMKISQSIFSLSPDVQLKVFTSQISWKKLKHWVIITGYC
jgi:hypothetical protein